MSVSPGWRLLLGVLRRLPQGMLSRATGWLADRPLPRWLRPLVIGGFARVVGIDRSEAAAAPVDYPSVGAYFARGLRAGVRSWEPPDDLPASPVDGVVGAMGAVDGGRALQAKGIDYSVEQLLAGVDGREPWWQGGRYLTLYLSPRHYHRIHTPVGGALTEAVSVPGRLLPVNRAAVGLQPALFATNERLVVRIDAPRGRMALVAVGAFNVGRITAAFEPGWAEGATNRPPRNGTGRRGATPGEGATHDAALDAPAPLHRRYDPPLTVKRGEELATFRLGSTVVLIFGPEWERTFAPGVLPEAEIRLGELLMEPPL